VINFGDVTNDGGSDALGSDSMIYVDWDVVTLDGIQNVTEYWLSAGAEYNNKQELWIGQAGFTSLLDDYANVSIVQYSLLLHHAVTERDPRAIYTAQGFLSTNLCTIRKAWIGSPYYVKYITKPEAVFSYFAAKARQEIIS